MELIAKELYHASFGTLNVGESTAGREVSEELKAQILEDHPEWFEVVEGEDEVVVETPEEKLEVETPEAKMEKTSKSRKK